MITSLQNPQVKRVVKLRDRRERDQTGLFLIEGYRELLRAVDAGVAIETLFTCEELFLGANEGALIERVERVEPCSSAVFRKMSYRDRPDGLIAVAKQLPCDLGGLKRGAPSLYVVAEAIEKPGNLGTILRSSDACSVDGLIVCDRCTDLHNPNVVRASVGTLFSVPVAEATSEEAIAWLRDQGVAIVAATPSAPSLYTEVDLAQSVAIAVGTEQLGLSERWLKEADLLVKLPMGGVADSLNVSVATAILLYEVVRQRSL